ncbi:neuraminidase-like domain-containing protein [Pseudomonas sp. FP1740]|uniref:Tc toxin subunit A-related protein n=1 Tax=Pseudomonas sp. FP1740 TaxID=2954078 RepID=UPI0027326AAA|nr:neuraminidase-like domain-containing protein [Pseudomonas sp. FP1740]WLG43837.1 neuraminidase-like domain-containing protein [Pseudomonas sp. FP1740]
MATLFVNTLEAELAKAQAALARNTRLIKYPEGVAPQSNEDLQEYLGIDPQSSADVRTTQVAQATATVQDYINRIYNGMEPGYDRSFDPEQLEYWQNVEGVSSRWYANQMIKDYPENYIDPALRIKRTRLFRTFEDNLNQTRLTEDSVHACIKEYLRGFQEISDLEVISGYVDSDQFKRATYYFISKERIEPFRHFWRKADIDLSQPQDFVNPTAWSEWELINIPPSDRMLDIRPVFWGGRLFVVWADWRKPLRDQANAVVSDGVLKIQASYLTLNGEWSVPFVLNEVPRAEPFDEKGGRLVAVVFAELDARENKLAVYFTNRASATLIDEPLLDIYDTRDTLMRKRTVEEQALLEMATSRFKDPLTLQYKIMPGDRPSTSIERIVGDSGEEVGDFNDSLGLEAVLSRELVGGVSKEVLRVRGTCSYIAAPMTNARFTLTFTANAEPGDPEDQVTDLALDGNARTEWMVIVRDPFPIDAGIPFRFAIAKPEGTSLRPSANVYAVEKHQDRPIYQIPKLRNSAGNAAQFLDFNDSVSGQSFQYTRLNTVIGPQLIARAEISVDSVLSWSTQHLPEPGWPGTKPEGNGPFEGSNGLYMWELFFHVVHLVVSRLRSEGRFGEAQRWINYIFDPALKAQTFDETDRDVPEAPKYWRCRPLMDKGDIAHELAKPNDPDGIAYGTPKHYRIAIFMEYVRTLVEWGDWLYRQLNRDDLAAAQLHYLRAQALMGEEPEFGTASDWVPQPIKELQVRMSERETLRQFERQYVLEPGEWPRGSTSRPYLAALGVEGFRTPINQKLLDTYEGIRQRLFNLRHELTIDGKPLALPRYSPAADPRQLLLAQAPGAAGLTRRMGAQLVVPPYRFKVMLDLALSALETHSRFGELLRQHLDKRDSGRQEELHQLQLNELGNFAITMQTETINQLIEARTALVRSRAVALARVEHFEQLSKENVSAGEYRVMDQIQDANTAASGSSAAMAVAAALDAFPNVYGTSTGGMQFSAFPRSLGMMTQIMSDGMRMNAERLSRSEEYRRRQQDWNLNSKQGRLELEAYDQQLAAQDHAIKAAQASLRHTETVNAHIQAMYAFLKQERDISVDFSGWMVGQMKNLYFPAHDAVVSLCQTAETCMRYETGDYESNPFIRSDVWQEKYHGLTASEFLKLDLLLMLAEYHKRHERRLELVKTISLKHLFDNQDLYGEQKHDSWNTALSALIEGGSLAFTLAQRLFDHDFPGHFCRQILSVSISLPVTRGPYQDMQAILLQTGSHTLTQAREASLEFMYGVVGASAGPDIKVNVRSSQQIGISSGLNDTGMVEMNFNNDRYFPFECTGAISTWILRFPRPTRPSQRELLLSLTDVIVKVSYMAKDAGSESDYAKLAQKMVEPPANP